MQSFRTIYREYQKTICQQLIFKTKDDILSIADANSKLSVELAREMLNHVGISIGEKHVNSGKMTELFKQATITFLDQTFRLLYQMQLGQRLLSVRHSISDNDESQEVNALIKWIRANPEKSAALENYFIKPDIIIQSSASTQDMRQENHEKAQEIFPLLPQQLNDSHSDTALTAYISCNLTLSNNYSQKTPAEGLNLIRNRKGHTPHIVVVTAEPMPTRLASLALGTGDIDCVYHFALLELIEAAKDTKNEAVIESLEIMIEGNRLRDISDLPFDLVT